MSKTALVTGSNRGIGLQIVKGLLQLNFEVIMTSRNEGKGLAAYEQLRKIHKGLYFQVLDTSREESMISFSNKIGKEFNSPDVLINNAGIFIDRNFGGLEIPEEVVLQTFMTNTIGPLRMSQLLIPMMRKKNYGRIVNLSSGLGSLNDMGPGYPAYRISKTALNAVTKILASETSGSDILINSMDPGWVKSDMGGNSAPRSLEQGAETALWLATLPTGGPSGKFFRDKKQIEW
jgi:NAD(P)-dependent dehydrogenase (short-subunit alcohol dehydrogenase family)